MRVGHGRDVGWLRGPRELAGAALREPLTWALVSGLCAGAGCSDVRRMHRDDLVALVAAGTARKVRGLHPRC